MGWGVPPRPSSSRVQALYELCKRTFPSPSAASSSPPPANAIRSISSLMDTISPADAGLRDDNLEDDRGHGFFESNFLKGSARVARWAQPITYLHIYECEAFSIGIFCLPTSAVIPLHDHPGMTVLSKILYGSMHVKSYDWIEPTALASSQPVKLAKLHTDDVLTAPCPTTVLYPQSGGNLHCFTSVTSCAVLDVLAPPYSEDAGRICTYFHDYPFSSFSGPARAGPLPVQTGFPTSLADLVVKNHGRLKKPSSTASASSKRKKRGVSPPPSPSPTPSPPPSSPPPPPPPAAAVSPSAQPRPDLSPVEAVRHTKGDVFGLGLGFLALGGVVSLALLVIWSKKVVAAVTVASFSLFLLESVRSSSLFRRPRLRSRPAATKKLDLDGRGYVSPIREVEAETEPPRPSCSDSDRGSEVSILVIEERSEVGDDSSNPKAKTKKRSSWKKLIANKLHKGRKCKEADSSGSFRSESNQADAMVGGNAKATNSSDSRRGKRNQADAEADTIAKSSDSSGSRHSKGNEMDAEVDNNARPIETDASPYLTEADDGGGSRFPVVVVVAVVLVGLVAGKLPAVAFTVLCSAFLSSVQRLHGR